MNSDRVAQADARLAELVALVRPLVPSCIRCAHFDEASEICGLVPHQGRPPARVIAEGCPAFVPGVPF